jgi:uncharacterized membrane protein
MDWMDRLALFSALDAAALGLMLAAWAGIGALIEHPPRTRPSVTLLMGEVWREWMRQMAQRDVRIFDAQMLASLRQGAAFFASASLLTVGAVLAGIGNTERFVGVASELTMEDAPAIVWEIKLLLVLVFLANAFLKFVWAHRLFGYCSALMGAVPNDPADPQTLPRALQAGEIQLTAARSFNRGLRSLYFALTAVAWLGGAPVLLGATLLTVLILYRREFASRSRMVLLGNRPTQT